MARFTASCSLAAAFLLTVPATPAPAGQPPAAQAPLRPPDVIFVPTPPEVVAAMLKVARVGKGDVIYDLGSGDGRIVISAVKDFGAARGVGIDIDPERIAEASENWVPEQTIDVGGRRVYFWTVPLSNVPATARQ